MKIRTSFYFFVKLDAKKFYETKVSANILHHVKFVPYSFTKKYHKKVSPYNRGFSEL